MKEHIKLGVLAAAVIVLTGGIFFVQTVFAKPNHDYKCKAYCPTGTVTPIITPTVAPTVIPTPTEEITPTATPSATPTVTPSVTPTSTPVTQPGNGPVVCTDREPGKVANIFVTTTGNTRELEVQWSLPADADKVHIEYGLEKSAQHSLLNTPNDGNEVIKGLTSGQHYWFRVAGVNGCSVGSHSEWFDPLVP